MSVFAVALLLAFDYTHDPQPIEFKVPEGWPAPNNLFTENPLTEEGFQLGRKIFYDPNLSSDGMVSCGNCHQQFAGFATLDHDLSHGVGSELSVRNAPALVNLAWMNNYHWDGGILHLEAQPLSPFTHPHEMNETLENVVAKIEKDTSYTSFFINAFGEKKVTMSRINKALVQFTANLISSNSKYDKVMRGQDEFTDFEKNGYEIFKANCATCHKEPLFTDNSFRNNGLALNYLNDVGRSKITGFAADSLKFKVPTLRNVQVTFPYMHDGSLMYLPNVIDHYTSIDTTSTVLDAELKRKVALNNKQKKELMYFLFTLTDSSFLKNPRFAPRNVLIYKH